MNLTKEQHRDIIEHDYHQLAFSRENYLNQIMLCQAESEAFKDLMKAGYVKVKLEVFNEIQKNAEKWEMICESGAMELMDAELVVQRLKDWHPTDRRSKFIKMGLLNGPKPYEQIQDEKANDDRF